VNPSNVGGGREVTFNPTRPGRPTPITIAGLKRSIACPPWSGFTGECIEEGGGALSGLACPTSSQCTAVDLGGRTVTFNPGLPLALTVSDVDLPGGLFSEL